MPIRKVLSNEKIKEDRNKLAPERGPLVYCAEGIDNNRKVLNLLLEEEAKFDSEYDPDLLNGITIIKAKSRIAGNSKLELSSWEEQDFKAIPYYA